MWLTVTAHLLFCKSNPVYARCNLKYRNLWKESVLTMRDRGVWFSQSHELNGAIFLKSCMHVELMNIKHPIPRYSSWRKTRPRSMEGQPWRHVGPCRHLSSIRRKNLQNLPDRQAFYRAFELPGPTGKSKGQKIQFHEWNHLESSNQTCFVVPLTLMSTVSSSHPPLCIWGQGRKLNKQSSKPLPDRGLVIQKPGSFIR